QEEALEGVAPGRDLPARAFGRLGDQHVLVAPCLRLDGLARSRAADLLIGIDDDHHWQAELLGVDYRLERGKRNHRAALHVVDGRAEALVAVAADRKLV